MTDFLKDVVRNRLELLGINPDMWVSDTFTEELKKKGRELGKKHPPLPVQFRMIKMLPDDSSYLEGISGLPDTIPAHFQDPSSSVGPSLRRSQRSQSKRCRLSSVFEEESSPPPTQKNPPLSSIQGEVFIPRRRPLMRREVTNFPSPLNLNVGAGSFTSNRIKKKIYMPSDLIRSFKDLSSHNSMNRVETGGILAGFKRANHFEITELIIPQQVGRHDKWEVEDEHQIINYFESHDILMLGLIHTHPGMDSFLSSVDLHALYDFAKDNESLISVVLAPEKNTSPAYSLTRLGFKVIGNCRTSGFHQHKNSTGLYTVASHVVRTDSAVNVQDFRI